MSPLFQTGVFAAPAPALAPQQSVMTEDQRAEFLGQQQFL